MSSDTVADTADIKERQRHPSTLIPLATVQDIAYRTYLLRLEPPMTPEQSVATIRHASTGKVIGSDEARRRNSKSLVPLVRDMLRVLVDMGMVVPPSSGV